MRALHAFLPLACSLRIPAPGRVVAVGDVHGDVIAFRSTLRACALIDDAERWVGGDAVLVQCGDVLDRGTAEAECLALLRGLVDEARDAGGRVVRLLGNHEAVRPRGYSFDKSHAAAGTRIFL